MFITRLPQNIPCIALLSAKKMDDILTELNLEMLAAEIIISFTVQSMRNEKIEQLGVTVIGD